MVNFPKENYEILVDEAFGSILVRYAELKITVPTILGNCSD